MQQLFYRSSGVRLATEPVFTLGPLVVDPPRRSVGRRDAPPVVVEPRVMQVLVALAQADGAVVGRDELVDRAWEGVVVGEAAINRAIARVRRLGEELGGAFSVETVTKVGYRLLVGGEGGGPVAQAPEAPAPARAVAIPDVEPAPGGAARLSRRALVAGGVATAAGAGGLLWWTSTADERRAREKAEALLDRVRMLQQLGTIEGGYLMPPLLEEAVRLDPGNARAWGQLALVRSFEPAMDPVGESLLRSRIAEAAKRAQHLDPGNADAAAALALMPATRIDWQGREAVLIRALTQHPSHFHLRARLAEHLSNAGRVSDAALQLARALEIEPDRPGAQARYFGLLWASGRLAEADKLARSSFQRWHGREQTWLAYFNYLALSGRPRAALALNDGDTPFPGGPGPLRELSLLSARALASGVAAERQEAIAAHWSARRKGEYPSHMAAPYLVQLGAPADAMTFLERMVLGPRLTDGQRPTAEASMRLTAPLFLPPMRPLWGEPRFGALLEAVGLEAYWRAAGIVPDFRKVSLAAR